MLSSAPRFLPVHTFFREKGDPESSFQKHQKVDPLQRIQTHNPNHAFKTGYFLTNFPLFNIGVLFLFRGRGDPGSRKVIFLGTKCLFLLWNETSYFRTNFFLINFGMPFFFRVGGDPGSRKVIFL